MTATIGLGSWRVKLRRPRTIAAMTTELPSDPYARIAEYYDLEHDEFDDDLAFYLNSIDIVGDPVLEIGCGSGRLVRPIAADGRRITGLDTSSIMLDRLSESLADQPFRSNVTSVQLDMREAGGAPGGPFGVVIFSLNGLMHAADPGAQLAALKSARAAIDPRGQLLIDLINPSLDTLREYDGRVMHEGSWETESGEVVEKYSVRRLTSVEQLIHTRIWYDRIALDGSVARTTSTFDLRYIHRNELELMLTAAGFCDPHFYGSYDLDPLDDHSDRMVVTAEVAG